MSTPPHMTDCAAPADILGPRVRALAVSYAAAAASNRAAAKLHPAGSHARGHAEGLSDAFAVASVELRKLVDQAIIDRAAADRGVAKRGARR